MDANDFVKGEIFRIGLMVTDILDSTNHGLFRANDSFKYNISEKYNAIARNQYGFEHGIVEQISRGISDPKTLHSLVSAVRIAVHFERIAARCKHIALSEIYLPEKILKKDTRKIKTMLDESQILFLEALESFRDNDTKKARRLDVKNLGIYSLYRRFNIQLSSAILKEPEDIEEYIKLLNVNRDIERLVTHVKHIISWIISELTGEEPQHEKLDLSGDD